MEKKDDRKRCRIFYRICCDNQKGIQLNHCGMTLVELLVVLALMGILAGGALTGIHILNSADAKKASNVLYSKLNELREDTLSIDASWKMIIREEDGSGYIEIYKNSQLQTSEKLGSRIEIGYKGGTTAESQKITGDGTATGVELTYLRGSGRFNSIKYGTVEMEKGASVTDLNASDDNELQHVIEIKGGSSTYEVTLWKNTGRITMEQK